MDSSVLEAVSRLHLSGLDALETGELHVQRIRKGMNNALYRVQQGEAIWAVKLFVADERRRGERETGALHLLSKAGLDLAPQPLAFDPSCSIAPYPALISTWLAGEALRPPLDVAALNRLICSVRGYLSVEPSPETEAMLPTAWFHWFDCSMYLDELDSLSTQYIPWLALQQPTGLDLARRLEALSAGCRRRVEGMPVSIGREHVARRLCHVDPNLNNAILGLDGKLRWVDWEYSGWGDPALELAEFRWHASLKDLDVEQLAAIRAAFTSPAGDHTFWERVDFWDVILSARWPLLVLRRLWSIYNGLDRTRLTDLPVAESQVWDLLADRITRAEPVLLRSAGPS